MALRTTPLAALRSLAGAWGVDAPAAGRGFRYLGLLGGRVASFRPLVSQPSGAVPADADRLRLARPHARSLEHGRSDLALEGRGDVRAAGGRGLLPRRGGSCDPR